MALDDINRNNSVLPNYDLNSVVYNGMCKSDVVMKAFINVIMNTQQSKSAIGFLGKFLSFYIRTANMYTLQSRTGKYRGITGKSL